MRRLFFRGAQKEMIAARISGNVYQATVPRELLRCMK